MNMSRMHWNSYGSSRNQHVAQLIMLIAAAAIAVPTAATLAEGERSGPEVVAFKDFAGPAIHGPDFWLEWPMDLVTTIIVQGWAEPALIDYAHAHGVRVLNTDGGDCYGDPGPIPWCANLSNATFRREQVRERGAKLAASPFDGFGFDFEHVTPAMFDGIVQYVLELKTAFPELFLAFYVGVFPGKVGWLPWDGESIRKMEPALDLVIAGLYSGINASAMPATAKWSDCTGSCAVTDIREVQAALSPTVGPGWSSFVPTNKLIMGVGWYARTWGSPAPFEGRISFCQAVALYKSLRLAGGSRQMDNHSSTWRFDCKHDLRNSSTWTACLPPTANETSWTTMFDDATSLRPKYALAKAAGWRGVGFWQADGMWPHYTLENVSIYCKEEMDEQWSAVRAIWKPSRSAGHTSSSGPLKTDDVLVVPDHITATPLRRAQDSLNSSDNVAPIGQVIPYFDSIVYTLEAENFTVVSGEWFPRAWAHSPGYFASNSANDFMSRRAYLHAPAHAINSTIASGSVGIQTAGTFSVLVRYEALYRFETPVRLKVTQAGKTLLDRIYGLRRSLKVWGYPYGHNMMCAGLVAECVWPWGSTDNTVWEGVGVTVPLQPGVATVTLEVSHSASPGVPLTSARFADRNVDVVLLTPNASDIKMRMANEFGEVPFDGLLSQAGEVFFRVTNYGHTNFSLVIPRIYGHGAGWWEGGHLAKPLKKGGTIINGCTYAGGPLCPVIDVEAGQTTDWQDVGAEMGVLQHGTWNLHGKFQNWTAKFANGTGPPVFRGAVPFGEYKIAVGVKLSHEPVTAIQTIGTFDCNRDANGFLQLLFDASTRATRRMRSQAADFFEIMDTLKEQTRSLHGRTPTMTPIYANTFGSGPPAGGGGGPSFTCPRCGAVYNETVAEYQAMFNIQSTTGFPVPGKPGSRQSNMSYIDIRGSISDPAKLAATLQQLTNVSNWPQGPVADDILTVSLGDEIAVANAGSDIEFIKFLQTIGKRPTDVGCATPSWNAVLASCNQTTGSCPTCGQNNSITVAIDAAGQRLYYYSKLYENEAGLEKFKEITATIQKSLPNARIGANFSPLQFFTDPRNGLQYCQMYMPDPFQWIRFFREGGATLPWSEDWAWMTPIGTQQMTGLMVDMMRAAMTKYPKSDNAFNQTILHTNQGKYVRAPNPPPRVGPPLLMCNTVNSWRRQFFGNAERIFDFDCSCNMCSDSCDDIAIGDIAHGVKYFDLFDFVPSYSGYTCDYVDSDGGAYTNVRRALSELGMFEDIVQTGTAQAQGAAVAILASESSNYWLRNAGTQGAAKRTLYIALKHGGYPVDFVLESDCIAGNLKFYNALFVADAQVSETATAAIAEWVDGGGVVVATAGAFALNEFNMSSASGQELLDPVNQTGLFVGYVGTCANGVQDHRCQTNRVQLSKQDLAYVEELDHVFVSNGLGMERATGVYGEKAILTMAPTGEKATRVSSVEATFKDGSEAILNISRGNGWIWYMAFHPGLSYFRTALPDTEPPCKGSTDDSYNHFVPTNFDQIAASTIYAPLANIPGARPITTMPALVEVGIVTSVEAQGTVLPVINWSGAQVDVLTVLLHYEPPHAVKGITTATGTNVSATRDQSSGFLVFTLKLESAADAIILRSTAT